MNVYRNPHYVVFIPLMVLFLVIELDAGNDQNIARSPVEVCAATPGTTLPATNVKTVDGNQYSIAESVTTTPAIVIFYRGGWCPYCNMHLQELRTIEDELIEMGYRIYAVSPDTPEKLSESLDSHNMKYTLLSDSDLSLGRELGIVFRKEQEQVERLREHGMDIEEYSGQDHNLLPVPAVFIVGTGGELKFTFVHPDYRIRLDSTVLVTAARSLLDEDWNIQR